VFLVGVLLILPIGLIFVRAIVRVLKLPQWAVMSTVLMISVIGTYSVSRQITDLWALLGFGVLGYLLRKGDFPLAPLVVGFVLGPIFEKNFRRTGLVSQGDLAGYILERPIALTVLAVTAAFIVVPLLAQLRRRAVP